MRLALVYSLLDILGLYECSGEATLVHQDISCKLDQMIDVIIPTRGIVVMITVKRYIFKRDLKWCPKFTKLRTLLLNDYWDLNIRSSAAVSENLTTVKVKCDMVDERVLEVLNFLARLNIYMFKKK
ncbi:hypothetical protein EJB05_28223, partial [Eragrostis curvula]